MPRVPGPDGGAGRAEDAVADLLDAVYAHVHHVVSVCVWGGCCAYVCVLVFCWTDRGGGGRWRMYICMYICQAFAQNSHRKEKRLANDAHLKVKAYSCGVCDYRHESQTPQLYVFSFRCASLTSLFSLRWLFGAEASRTHDGHGILRRVRESLLLFIYLSMAWHWRVICMVVICDFPPGRP